MGGQMHDMTDEVNLMLNEIASRRTYEKIHEMFMGDITGFSNIASGFIAEANKKYPVMQARSKDEAMKAIMEDTVYGVPYAKRIKEGKDYTRIFTEYLVEIRIAYCTDLLEILRKENSNFSSVTVWEIYLFTEELVRRHHPTKEK